MKILALVTIKSTSSRVAYKNKMPLYGKPLYRWTIDFLAEHHDFFEDTCFSSDRPQDYRMYSNMIPLIRPQYYLLDSTPHIESVKHGLACCEKYTGKKYDLVMLFQPTNPYRTSQLLYHALTIADHCMGKEKRLAPHTSRCAYHDKNLAKKDVLGTSWPPDERGKPPTIYSGALYCYEREYLAKNFSCREEHTMFVPKQVGYNINDELDFSVVEAFMKQQGVPYGYGKSWFKGV